MLSVVPKIKKLPDLSRLMYSLDLSNQNFNCLSDANYRNKWEEKQRRYKDEPSKLQYYLKAGLIRFTSMLLCAFLLACSMWGAMYCIAIAGVAHIIIFTLVAGAVLLLASEMLDGLNAGGLIGFLATAIVLEFSSMMALSCILLSALAAVLVMIDAYGLFLESLGFFPALYESMQARYSEFQGDNNYVLIQYLKSIPENVTSMNLNNNGLGELPTTDLLKLLHAIPSTVKFINFSDNALFEGKSEGDQQAIYDALRHGSDMQFVFGEGDRALFDAKSMSSTRQNRHGLFAQVVPENPDKEFNWMKSY